MTLPVTLVLLESSFLQYLILITVIFFGPESVYSGEILVVIRFKSYCTYYVLAILVSILLVLHRYIFTSLYTIIFVELVLISMILCTALYTNGCYCG